MPIDNKPKRVRLAPGNSRQVWFQSGASQPVEIHIWVMESAQPSQEALDPCCVVGPKRANPARAPDVGSWPPAVDSWRVSRRRSKRNVFRPDTGSTAKSATAHEDFDRQHRDTNTRSLRDLNLKRFFKPVPEALEQEGHVLPATTYDEQIISKPLDVVDAEFLTTPARFIHPSPRVANERSAT